MNPTIYGMICGWLGGFAFGALLWYAKASAYNLHIRNKKNEEIQRKKQSKCACGQFTLKECATMPSRHCGLWNQE